MFVFLIFYIRNVMQPKVSIVLPIYGVEKYLDRCMDRILNQTLKEIEIIMVDDGSPDCCPQLCDEYAKKDSRVKVIHKENEGLGYARNSGMKMATGEFIAFIDSDDYVSYDMMAHLYGIAKEYQAQAVYCGINIVNSDGFIMDVRREVDELTCFTKKQDLFTICLDMISPIEKNIKPCFMMSVWHSIFDLQFLHLHNLSFCSERDFVSEDMIFDIDFFTCAEKVIFIPDPYYYYCHNDVSLSHTFNLNRYGRYRSHYKELLRRMPLKGFSAEDINYAHKFMISSTRNYLYNLFKSSVSYPEKRNLMRMVLNDREVWDMMKQTSVHTLLASSIMPFYRSFVNNMPIMLEFLIRIHNFKCQLKSNK